jgi:MFS transporter, DHA3 family, macrolide efflux protein
MVGPYIELLKNRNFLFLWIGQIISQFGDRLMQIALIGLVYQRLGVSPLGLSKIMFFTILPVFLIGPVAGVYIDRWDKRRTMYIADFIRGVLIVFMALFVIGLRTFIPLYILIFLVFSVGRFFVPAKMAIVPNLVDKEHLFIANSLVIVTGNVAAILGFGVGGIIVELYSAQGAFFINAITFFFSSLCILFISKAVNGRFKRSDLAELGRGIIQTEKSLLHEFKEGVHYLFSKESTRFSIKNLSILFACLGALYVVFIVFIQEALQTGTKDLGFFAVWLGIGIFIGSLLYGRIAHKFSLFKTINFMFFLSSVFLVIFVVLLKIFPDAVLACFLALILGGLVAPIVVGCNSLIHSKSHGSFWGRIFSSLEVVMHFAFVVFMFSASGLAEVFSPGLIIAGVGIISSGVSLFSLIKGKECLD